MNCSNPEDETAQERQEEFIAYRVVRPLLAVIVATAVLYLGRDFLLPVALASVLAIIFSPIANRLERFVGRSLSAAMVVLVAIATVSGVIYFLTVELTSVAAEVAGYSDNIAAKVNALKNNTPQWMQRVEEGVAEVKEQIQTKDNTRHTRKPALVQTAPAAPEVTDVIKPVMPVLATLGDALLVMVLLFFLLYDRRDLRDRFVRLAARGRITIAAQAIEAAVDTVGHYLLLFSLTNFAFGVTIGAVVWFLGLPNPFFWGGLAFLLRYVPYVGTLIAAALPAIVAFAVFPGWDRSLEVVAAFILLDQISAQLVEPLLIGHGIGLSPVALLIAAMYWAWLWGVVGLLLATPLTACLKVAGDYIPSLEFLALLLEARESKEDYQEFYRRLLEMDRSGARKLAIRHYDENGMEPTIDEIIAPTLVLAGQERAEDHISTETEQFITEAATKIVIDLSSRLIKHPQKPQGQRVRTAT